VAPHIGRGGWSWYTGSAGWMYRLLIESLLGLSLQENRLQIRPCVPSSWAGYNLRYVFGGSTYVIDLRPARDGELTGILLDGASVEGDSLPLKDDQKEHEVHVVYPRG
jgi:cellobiose phosphorylase